MAIDADELADFLIKRKGGLELLLKIDTEEGDLTSDLQSKINVAPDTVQDRLGEATAMGLLDQGQLAHDHGNANRYQLTEQGEKLREELVEVGIEEDYQQVIEAKQALTDSLREFVYNPQQKKNESRPEVEEADIINEENRHPFHRRSER